MKEYESIQGMAALLGVTEKTIRNRLKGFRKVAGPLDLIHDGKVVRIRAAAFIVYLNERRRSA